MRDDIRRRYDAHLRATVVCGEYSGVLDATPGGQKRRKALGKSVEEVARLLAAQERSFADRRAAVAQCRTARRILRDAVRVVVNVGKIVTVDDTPMGTMRIPRSVSDDELLAYTQALLERVSPHAAAFVAEGMPPDLLAVLTGAMESLTAARNARTSACGRFVAAAASIRESQQQASKTIAVIDAIAVTMVETRPDILVSLRTAKRVGSRAAPSAQLAPALALAAPVPSPTERAA